MTDLSLTKIIATIGPASETMTFFQAAHRTGMAAVRLNLSHGDHAEHKFRIDQIKKRNVSPWRPIGLMLDTKGPELRIGRFKISKVIIKAQAKVIIWTSSDRYRDYLCPSGELTLSFDISSKLQPKTRILVDDGKLELLVESIDRNQHKIITRALNTHTLIANKRVNIPGIDFGLPFLSLRDQSDIEFGLEHNINFIALSFVSRSQDVLTVQKLCQRHNRSDVQLISKIESQTGVDNLDSIIEVSDGIMVARGDLGLEVPLEQLPFWQSQMIAKCRQAHKIVIVATQMLDSMTYKPIPTRAEINDVYTATTALVDATMLSGETANGDFPALATATMHRISQEAERHLPAINIKAITFPRRWKRALRQIIRQILKTRSWWVVIESDDWAWIHFLSRLRLPVHWILFTAKSRLAEGASLWRGVHAYLGLAPVNRSQKQLQLPSEIQESLGISNSCSVLFINGQRKVMNLDFVFQQPSTKPFVKSCS